MTIDPTSPLFDPSAAAFHILSERIHDLEDNMTLLLDNAKHQDMCRRNTYLSNKLYGYRFPIIIDREAKVDLSGDSSPYLKQAEITVVRKEPFDEDLTRVERLKLVKQNLGELVSTRYSADVKNKEREVEPLCKDYKDLLPYAQYKYVFSEALFRALKKHVAIDKFSYLSEVSYASDGLAFRLFTVTEATVAEFIDQAVKLWKTILPVDCIQSLVINPEIYGSYDL